MMPESSINSGREREAEISPAADADKFCADSSRPPNALSSAKLAALIHPRGLAWSLSKGPASSITNMVESLIRRKRNEDG